MDNTQSSDVFSENEEYAFGQATDDMSGSAYETLVHDTKLLLSKNVTQEVVKTSFSTYVASVLGNCRTCISQSLDQVIGLISEIEVNIPQLCEYLDDAVTILRLLSGFITALMESVSMTCQKIKTFPVDTGKIIMTVFSHCKDSESIYGLHIKSVERQLKDLFRNCHELQLTYLMILGKNFVFDLSELEQLSVLVEALEINLKIGEIVQTLDVKTMAEQWKAYTMICEKYSDSLKDKQIHENCTKILFRMIENNISTALEIDQEEKIVLRSLKVASFTIKILVRICNVFKHSTGKNYDAIMNLLIYIYLNNPYSSNPIEGKSPELLNSINNHIFVPTEVLLKELLQDEKFIDGLQNLNTFNPEDKKSLSYILLVISATKHVIQGNVAKTSKNKIIDCIFKWLPNGHIWFNLGLKFKSKGDKSMGLYEHLIAHTFALALTLDSDEMCFLEQKMYESILGTDCYKALFTTNLWELLAKSSTRAFVLAEVMSLCKIYQKLETYKIFSISPQKVHLSHIISILFKNLHVDDINKICKNFDPYEERNIPLWTALRIESLPFKDKSKVFNEIGVEQGAIEKFKQKIHMVFNSAVVHSEDIDILVKLMKLISTGNCVLNEEDLQNCIIKAWSYICSKSKRLPIGPITQESVWFLEYIEALVILTLASRYIFLQNENVIKVLHVVDSLMEESNTELKLILINLLFKTSRYSVDDENQHIAHKLHEKIFKTLMLETDSIKHKLFNDISKRRIPNVERIIMRIAKEDITIQQSWKDFQRRGSLKALDLKDQLSSTFDLSFSHKCLENDTIVLSDSVKISKSNSGASNNFDFVDMDTLFETESDSEPASKRVKLNSDEAKEILTRIENEVSLLSNIKENVLPSECKVRIREVCERLLNIID